MVVGFFLLFLINDMSSWIEQVGSSHRLQLATTAVVSGLVVGGAIIGYQNTSRRYRLHELKDSISDPRAKHDVNKVCFGNSFVRVSDFC